MMEKRMKFKGILLDMDNTLYDYHRAHEVALNGVATYAADRLHIPPDRFRESYRSVRRSIHEALCGTAASHNRLLYFQRILERAGSNPFHHSLVLYEMYWDRFLDAIELFDGVDMFFARFSGTPICLVTDLTADVQHRKIKKLRLEDKISALVTSEEIGKEKPAPEIFSAALKKIDRAAKDVCMIGDDYARDIDGARRVGIHPFWLRDRREPPPVRRAGPGDDSREERTKHDMHGVTECFTFNEIVEVLRHDPA
jgi:HAD superfamily hydrolase (TIGR01549 family)